MFAIGIAVCLVAFITSYWAGRKSLGLGLSVTFFWGYYFGILRANILSPASHFTFDCALMGCYASLLLSKQSLQTRFRVKPLQDWVMIIGAWTLFIALIPFQTPLVTLVGLRGNFFILPVVLLAARLTDADFREVITGLAILNISAFLFSMAEYTMGVELFFPYSSVTQIIYNSHDSGDSYRIPSVFSNAHSYALAMNCTLPMLLSMVGIANANRWQRLLCLLGGIAAMAGVLFSNTRTNFALMAAILISFLMIGKIRFGFKVLTVAIMVAVVVVGGSNDRFKRFQTLQDTDAVSERIAGSVNRSFIEVVEEYPMGNGLGGGGTSVPYFLAHEVRKASGVENEYARLALELGIPGLILWIGFIGWVLTRGLKTISNDPWRGGRRVIWVLLTLNFMSSLIGTGLLTAIPGTMLIMFNIGWMASRPPPDSFAPVEGDRISRSATLAGAIT